MMKSAGVDASTVILLAMLTMKLTNGLCRAYGVKNQRLQFPTYSDADNARKRQPLSLEKLSQSPIEGGLEVTKGPRPYERAFTRLPVLARKLGMMTLYDEWGAAHPVTAVHIERCQALGARTLHRLREHRNTQTGLLENIKAERMVQDVGAGTKSPHQCRRHLQLYFRRCSVHPKLQVAGGVVQHVVPPGTWLRAAHFLAGQFVDVTGMTKGKGFQGVMRRHGFHGFPASHGTSLVHRHAGSVGCRRDGKVWRGRKMPGRMGHDRRCVKHVHVLRIDHALDVLFLRGSVPGPRKGWLVLRDSRSNPLFHTTAPPYPTFFAADSKGPLPRLAVASQISKRDPLHGGSQSAVSK
jgi:large subunit ribosomal protein L3